MSSVDAKEAKKEENGTKKENGTNAAKKTDAVGSDETHTVQSKQGHRVFYGSFKNAAEEALYQEYIAMQKLDIIPAFVTAAVIYLVNSVLLELSVLRFEVKLPTLVAHSVFIVLTLLVLAALKYMKRSRGLRSTFTVIFLWAMVTSAVLFGTGFRSSAKAETGTVGWIQVEIFTSFVVIPWRLRWVLLTSVLVGLLYTAETASLWYKDRSDERAEAHAVLIRKAAANWFLFSGAILLGVLAFLFSDWKQRHSFRESKKSHFISSQIEKESKEQERLLLSVLPKHVADEMIRDMGTNQCGQFRKVYMSRQENVSILFADIVGFTAISSSVTAAELVKILNQLFASFDELAAKYHQQRIKILGDCYYCVCGALPVRPDHAVLSIHMGMSMVDAIREVRERTGKEVNMRVGIHTGAVLGGVLGQKQWQYDVLGKEVTLANHMESGGLPARVHISEATKRQLRGEFELEPGRGAERDEYLKLANMESYLIRSVIKPYPQGTLDADLDPAAQAKAEEEESGEASDQTAREDNYQDEKLKEALLDRKRSKETLRQMRWFTTWFRDSETEVRYQKRLEQFTGASMAALAAIFPLATAAKLIVLPRSMIAAVTFIVAEMMLVFMATVSSVTWLNKRFKMPQSLIRLGAIIDRNRWARTLWGLVALLILVGGDAATILQCDVEEADLGLHNVTNLQFLDPNSGVCPYPAYFVYVSHLILLGVSFLVHIEHMIKFVVVCVTTAFYSLLYLVFFASLFDYYDGVVSTSTHTSVVVPTKYQLSVQMISAALAILVLNRKMEEICRHLFLWEEESKKQRQRVTELRQKNEALVYNILPAHVARDFTGRRRPENDLYSHAYDEAAVMFAACPNFHDFYSESAVNNEGLECLRFLNEIISDYDELLNKPRFHSITKIKTVGPTYMAASGMNFAEKVEHTTIQGRWQHLDDLVQFALSMQEVLTRINEQSFNSFILRIGINHGPIIAGVIGVRKPHYDIWGNTVNVSSRMESTGMAGKIQVVEETKFILEEFGYYFTKRGLVKVKGKGELMTYFLDGQDLGVLAQKKASPTPLKPAKAVCPKTTAPQESQAAVPPSAPDTSATNLAPRKASSASRSAASLPQSGGEAQPTGSKVKVRVDERGSSQRKSQGSLSMNMSLGSEDFVPIVDIVSVASAHFTADSLVDLNRQKQGRQAPILSALVGGGVPDSSEKASSSESSRV